MKMIRFAFVAALLVLISSIYAQSPASTIDYPTVAALEQAVVPVADAVNLAQRFKGVDGIPTPPTRAPVHQVGEVQTFWVANTDENREFQISATLRVIGQHIYMWVQSDIDVNTDALQKLAD